MLDMTTDIYGTTVLYKVYVTIRLWFKRSYLFNYHLLKSYAVEILLEVVQVPSACVVRSAPFVGKVAIGN